MKAITSIFRIGRRRWAGAWPIRKRPARAFASTFAPLEGRAMLTVVGTGLSTITTLSATTTPLIQPPSPQPNSPGHDPDGDATSRGGQAGSPPSGSGSGSGSGVSVGDGSLPDPVAMAVARVSVDGKDTPEFALADLDASKVYVRVGFGGPTAELGPDQGVDHPTSVALEDINGDGVPDLIIANTGGNNILIFPGLGDGRFGPELNDGQGFATGVAPASVYVDYVDHHPDQPQIIVANKGSNSVTILSGQAVDGTWTVTSTATIATPSQPVKALPYDVNGDGKPDLLVCDSGAGVVTEYAGLGGGQFATTASATFTVGTDPDAMFIGQFDRRPGVDLVTLNAGSDDLSLISDVFGPQPTTQTIASDGTSPDAGFAFGTGRNGLMDLVVANGGDGRLAIFRGGSDSLQLAGVITQASLPTPTAVAPGSSDGHSLDFFAANAGNDAALLLQFDLGIASEFLPAGATDSAVSEADGELFAQLMPLDGSSLDLVAALWAGTPDAESAIGGSNPRETSTITALYSPTEGQGGGTPDRLPLASSGSSEAPELPAGPPIAEDSPVYWFVAGLGTALDAPRGFDGALAARDFLDDAAEPPATGLARLDPDRRSDDRSADPEVEITSGLLHEILRLDHPGDGGGALAPGDPPARDEPVPTFDEVEAPALEGRFEIVPLISAALVLSGRVILKGSPPRPPGFRGKSRPARFVSLGHDRQAGDRPDPL